MRVTQSTAQRGWGTARSAVAAAESDLTPANSRWADRPAEKCYTLRNVCKAVELAFRGNDNAATGSFSIYTYRRGGDAQLVCTGTVVIGNMEATKGGYYADDITVTGDYSRGKVDCYGVRADGMALLSFDPAGAEELLVLFTSVSEGDNLSVDISSF